MNLTSSVFFVLGTYLAASAQAAGKEVRFNDMQLNVAAGDRLVISGLHGNVRLVAAADGKPAGLRIKKVLGEHATSDDRSRFENLSFNAKRNGTVIIIEERNSDGKSAESKSILSQALSATGPELDFEIESPSLPVEINLRSGQVQVENWRQNIALNLVKGSVRTQNTEGRLQLQIQHGEVRVSGHKGRLALDSYGAKLVLQDVDGPLDLTNFAGETAIREAVGALDVRSQSGSVAIAKSSGSVDFLNGRGSFNLDGFDGPIRGSSDQGTVSAVVEGEAEVQIDSNQAAVNVKLPSNSGASLRLQTDDGNLSVPANVAASAGHGKVISTHLPGEGPKGAVAVKSKTGTVRIRL